MVEASDWSGGGGGGPDHPLFYVFIFVFEVGRAAWSDRKWGLSCY